MRLLTPLGLLGLLSIIVLIIIYIIRPNYQNKFISSTFVWKLSLKYRKKRIPISKLRNILLIICQILILTACALIMAQPNQILKTQMDETEVIAIIDSSGSMRAGDETTRFERAVSQVKTLADQTFDENGIMSVIIANEKPAFLRQRATLESQSTLVDELDALIEDGDIDCSYASSDIDAAIALCEDVLIENPSAQIYLYTDTTYAYVPKNVNLVPVSDPEEWNASILNAATIYEDNYYSFVVDVACYGRDMTLDVTVEVDGANASDSTDEGMDLNPFVCSVDCSGDEVMQVIFVNADIYAANPDRFDMTYDYIYEIDGDDDRVYSYQHVNVSIDVEDSFERDNYFDIYGGQKEVIRVQYASEAPNNFWPAALTEIRNVYEDRWDIQITEVKKGEEPAIEGFDFYIFEHTMPEQMPKDGVLFLVNPDKVPSNLGIRIGNTFQANSSLPLEGGDPHDVLHHITPDKITVTRFNQVVLDGSYTTILGYGNYPMLGVRNEEDSKVVVMPFSLHYSNFAILLDFPLMLYNTFEYFFPATVESNSFEVNETVFLNARGSELTVEGNGGYEQVFDSFPASFTVSEPGTYTLYQTTFTGKDVTEKIYVRVPAEECNIWQTAEAVAEPYKVTDESDLFRDLLLFIAAALVALVFIEWWLKGQDAV